MKTINVIFSNHYVAGNQHTFTLKIKNPDRKTTATVVVKHNGHINLDCYEELALYIHSYMAPPSKAVSTIHDHNMVTLKDGYRLIIDARRVCDSEFSVYGLQAHFNNECYVLID